MKNIVLLSDGTGNGAAKKNKTNVWRLYSALDLHDDSQIAMYDDGVGSKDSLWSRVMGGAFGWGLKRNVVELYKYLCRNYEFVTDVADSNNDKAVVNIDYDKSDNIYLFGFSRGAFTVRVLASFVAQKGICTEYGSEKELHDFAMRNYREYWDCYSHGYLNRFWRVIQDIFNKKPALQSNVYPNIKFLGVWDTVAAYGFPIYELATLWDFFIYPIRFPGHKLNAKVERACHAVSVDDERHSFHPLMWDEKDEVSERIEQVWFPGVHADVGGGYPRQSLSLVTLDWMLTKVEASKLEPNKSGHQQTNSGLLFIEDIRNQYHSQSDWNGPLHDSRAGLGMYYRYKPRNITQISNNENKGVFIAKPKIHQSVFERIKGHSIPYAPTGIPADYEVVSTDGKVREYEKSGQSSKRSHALNYALDVIFWRRLIYYGILFSTIFLLLSRFYLDWEENGICKGSACFIDPVLQLTMNSLPDFTNGWFEALRQNPKWLWGVAALFTLLLTLRSIVWRLAQRKAMCAWAVLKGRNEDLLEVWRPGFTYWLRKLTDKIGPKLRWAIAIFLFVIIIDVLAGAINGVVFHFRYTTGSLCKQTDNIRILSSSKTISFDIDNACYGTGIKLRKDKTYVFEVGDSIIHDGERYQTDADGFSADRLIPFVPFRRHIEQPWLKLYGKIKRNGYEEFVLGKGRIEYTPREDGELFLYVNDAVFGLLPKWDLPYYWKSGKNIGRITVIVAPK